MNREQERAKRRLEKNPVVECNKIQNKYTQSYLPNLLRWMIREIKVILNIQ